MTNQEKLDMLEAELNDYVAENVATSDADGDWVLFIEHDDYASKLQEEIDKLAEEIKENGIRKI